MDDHKLKPLKDPGKEIKIDKGQGNSLDKLIDCFFYPTSVKGAYLLCSKDDENLVVVTSEQPFMFAHGGLIWKVPNPDPNSEPFRIDDQGASGSYWNNDPHFAQDDSGTFIARASGGGGAGDEANASYAGAK